MLPEREVQKRVVKWLRSRDVFCHGTMNGLPMGPQVWTMCKAAGAHKGIPDILIFTPPPNNTRARFVGLELKKDTKGRLSDAQKACAKQIEACGGLALVGYGLDDAIDKLKGLGY